MRSNFRCLTCGAVVMTSRLALHSLWLIWVPLALKSLWHNAVVCQGEPR
jgi:hypothetical protein